MDRSAITTVPPANSTALPEVATARATDSWTSTPFCSSCLWRVTMNSA